MNFDELVKMMERHREEILSLLSPLDDEFLKTICSNVYDKERKSWKSFMVHEYDMGKLYDEEGEIQSMRDAGIVILDYIDTFGRKIYDINPAYRTLLIKRYDF
jgi:hypothetical protein